MKPLRIAASLVLTLILVFNFSCIASAEEPMPPAQDAGYLAIGTCISRGNCKEGYAAYANPALRNVEQAFPYMLAQDLGCDMPELLNSDGNFWPCTYGGMTLDEAMALLGVPDDYEETEFVHGYKYKLMLQQFGGPQSISIYGEDYAAIDESNRAYPAVGALRDLAQKAKLITVELGMGDVLYRAQVVSGFDERLFGMTTPELAEAAAGCIKEVYKGFDYWKENYPKFIRELQSLNPDATIVMVGSFNPVAGVTLNNESVSPIGDVIGVVTGLMNECYKQWERELGVLYADVRNTETGATQNNMSLFSSEFTENVSVSTHPTFESYQYIYRQISNLLPKGFSLQSSETAPEIDVPAEPEVRFAGTNIVVDLNRFKDVSYVMLNGKLLREKDYQVDGYTLTIPNRTITAFNLTVAVVDADKNVSVCSYLLTYSLRKGYTATRIYSTNNVGETVKKGVTSLKNITGKLTGGLSSLFPKAGQP